MTPEMRAGLGRFVRSRGFKPVALVAGAITAMLAVGVVWALMQIATPGSQALTAMLPKGALLTIEAKDFSAVLKRWNDSPEQQAWLKSDNYEAFSRSRLFSRLGDAQKEFARAAGLPPDGNFLNEVAGRQSVFAWYDIGRLEFLYITEMPAGGAEKTQLVQLRGKFTARQVAGETFYIRNSASPGIATGAGADSQEGDASGDEAGVGEVRTVAFATVGDWLILATREDLMAGALMLMKQAKAGTTPADSLAGEPWFGEARAAGTKEIGDLRMTLNLDRIVPSPYFRSYWVQRNVTEMKQYRSAVTDLYLGSPGFREERVLLPKAVPDAPRADEDLRSLTALLPDHAGVYRAVASPDTEAAVASLDEKLLARGMGSYNDWRYAPQANLTVQNTGAATDLETRIDEPVFTAPAKGSELDTLRQALDTAGLVAMMTVSRTGQARDGIWVPYSAGVVLRAAKPWDESAMETALKRAVAAHVTAGSLGLDWKPVSAGNAVYFEMSETRPLEVAFRGDLCMVTDDPELMRDMLMRAAQPAQGSGRATSNDTVIAGFDLTRERPAFARWTNIVDRVGQRGSSAGNGAQGDGTDDAGTVGFGGEPGFFSRNMRSLGTAFSALESERFVERRDGPLVRQSVTYAWKR